MDNIIMDRSEEIRYIISKHFSGLVFDEESHSYTYDNQKLLSTSYYIKQRFSNDFKAYEIATSLANSFKSKCPECKERDKYYYIYRWKHQGLEATSSGSRVHNYAEYNYPSFVDEPVCDQEQGVVDFYNNLDSKYVMLFLELKMFMKDYLKAGTADGIFLNTETNKIVILDYKTNNKNIHQCYNNSMLRGVFSDMSDCKLNQYAIQLNDYTNMIEMVTGYEVEERWIIHFSKSDIYSLDKGKDPNKYVIDDTIKPYVTEDLYKLYKIPNYTDRLKKDYELWKAGQ